MQVKRPLAMLFDKGLGFGILTERPGFIAAEVKMLNPGHECQDIIDHVLDQLSGTGRERVQARLDISDLAQMLIPRHAERRLHMPQALDQRVGEHSREAAHDHAHGKDITQDFFEQFLAALRPVAVAAERSAAQFVDLRRQVCNNRIDMEPLRVGLVGPGDLGGNAERPHIRLPAYVECR